jgi:hypothetical protein
MDDPAFRAAFERACDERVRLAVELEAVRSRQGELLARALDAVVLPRLAELARDLKFAVDGRRACGVTLTRGEEPTPFFVLLADDTWQLIARHAHGMNARVTLVDVRVLVETLGADAMAVLLGSLAAAESARRDPDTNAITSLAAPRASRTAGVASTRRPTRADADADADAKTSVAPRSASHARAAKSTRARTLPCPACDAEPNAENFARHLRAIHGLEPDAMPARRASTPAHEICRLCKARLPTGRLDAHLTVAHGVFRVHPRGATPEGRRAAARNTSRTRARSEGATPTAASRNERPDLSGSLARMSSAGRDFSREARVERTLVVRAASPELDRDREGRFSDAPDVERMDDDSDA